MSSQLLLRTLAALLACVALIASATTAGEVEKGTAVIRGDVVWRDPGGHSYPALGVAVFAVADKSRTKSHVGFGDFELIVDTDPKTNRFEGDVVFVIDGEKFSTQVSVGEGQTLQLPPRRCPSGTINIKCALRTLATLARSYVGADLLTGSEAQQWFEQVPPIQITYPSNSGTEYVGVADGGPALLISSENAWDVDVFLLMYGRAVRELLLPSILEPDLTVTPQSACLPTWGVPKGDALQVAFALGWTAYFSEAVQRQFSDFSSIPGFADQRFTDSTPGASLDYAIGDESDGIERGEDNPVAITRALWDFLNTTELGVPEIDLDDRDLFELIRQSQASTFYELWSAAREIYANDPIALAAGGRILALHGIGPQPVFPEANSSIPVGRLLKDGFRWVRGVGCDSTTAGDTFQLTVVDRFGNPIIVAAPLSEPTYLPSPDEVIQMLSAEQLTWIVEASNSLFPSTGPYLGQGADLGAVDGPVITQVDRQYPGFFLESPLPLEEDWSVDVLWEDEPGMTSWQVAEDDAVVESGTSHTINVPAKFPAGWYPIYVSIVPMAPDGTLGQMVSEEVYRYPIPTWLVAVLAVTGNSVSTTVSETSVEWSFDMKWPPVPFDVNDVIPAGILWLTGPIGFDAQVAAGGSVQNSGEGKLSGGAVLSSEVAGVNKEIEAKITGTFQIGEPDGLRPTGLGICGTYADAVSVDVNPLALSPIGRIASRFPVARRVLELASIDIKQKLAISVGLQWEQNAARNLTLISGAGSFGGDTVVDLNLEVTDSIKFFFRVGGSYAVTLNSAAAQPVSLDLSARAGAGLKFFALLEVKVVFEYACDGVGSGEATCRKELTVGGDIGARSSVPKLTPIVRDYQKFGDYARFVRSSNEQSRKSNHAVEEFIENIFSGADPILRATGSGRVLLWVHQDVNDPDLQSGEISWSLFDGQQWSVPALISDDTQHDSAPQVGTDETGSIVAVWSRNSDPSFTEVVDDVDQLSLFTKKLELAWSVLDPVTMNWGPVAFLTDNTAFDSGHLLSQGDGGSLMVTWIANEQGVFNSTSEAPSSLYSSFWDSTLQTWSTPFVVANGLVGVSKHAASIHGSQAVVVVPIDPDPDATGDARIDAWIWNGSEWTGPTVFASGDGQDHRNPLVTHDSNGEAILVWQRGLDLVWASLVNPMPQVIRVGGDSVSPSDMRLVSSPEGLVSLIWGEDQEGTANLMFRTFDPNTGLWSFDQTLIRETEVRHGQLEGYYDDNGMIQATYLATAIDRNDEDAMVAGVPTIIPNVPTDGQTNLRLLSRALSTDLLPDDDALGIDPDSPLPGESVIITAVVRNEGELPASNFEIAVFAGDPAMGVLVASETINTTLVGGDAVSVDLALTLPSGEPVDLVVVVDDPDVIAEADEANNSAVLFLTNAPPVARLFRSSVEGNAPVTVMFDGSSSSDPEDSELSYFWSFGDGTPPATTDVVEHTFTEPGEYLVSLVVEDDRGGRGNESTLVSVGPLSVPPPVVPDGRLPGTSAMRVGRDTDQLTISWDVTTCGSAEEYVLFSGTFADFGRVETALCALGTTGTATVDLPGDAVWWIITGANDRSVGGFGQVFGGFPRVLTGWTEACGRGGTQDLRAECPTAR